MFNTINDYLSELECETTDILQISSDELSDLLKVDEYSTDPTLQQQISDKIKDSIKSEDST